MTDSRLLAGLDEIEREIGGAMAVAARHLTRGLTLDRNSDRRFPSASVIKVPILVALFEEVREGRARLDETLALRDEDRVEGSGVLQGLRAGLALTLEDLAFLMITVSDNTASNMLIDRLGPEAVSACMARMGLPGLRLERKFYDFAARDRGLDNWITAGEMATLLERLERREILTPELCDRALAIMEKQQFTGRIPALLPADVKVAHKTGSVTGICHDAGIVRTPGGPLVLVVLSEGAASPTAAEGGIRHVARLFFEHWGKE